MKVIGRGRRALVGVLLAITAGSASFGAVAMTSSHASGVNPKTAPPTSLSNDPAAILGGVDFFNAAGTQITSGSLTAPFAAFAVAEKVPASAQTPQKASLYAYTPVLGVAPGSWSGSQIHKVTSVYPVTTPAALAGLPSGMVVYTGTAKDTSLTTYTTVDFPNTDTSTTDGYAGMYTIRVTDVNGDYGRADIMISGSTWTQEDGQFTLPGSGSGPTGTSTTLTVGTPSPVAAGTSITFTATVTPSAPGTVQFKDGATVLSSTVPVTGGVATYTTTTLPAGTHSITAVFTPNDSTVFSTSTSDPLSYVVNAAGATTTTTAIAASPDSPVTAGTSVTFTATVAPATAPGSVQFMDGATAIGDPVTVGGDGTASLSYSTLSVDTHSITAVFTSSSPSSFGGSTSPALSFQVTAAAGGGGPTATNTVVTASPTSPQTVGTAVTFTATVTPSAAGTVQFKDGTTNLGDPVTVTTGASSATASAAATSSLIAGTHPITAVFTPADSSAFATSTSTALSYMVNAAGTPLTTTTTVTSSVASPTTTGTSVTFTATLAPNTAVGTVQFMNGTATMGSPVAVTSGTATYTTSFGAANTYSITAVFTPTSTSAFTTSTSPAFNYVVTGATVTSTALAISPASTAAFGASVTLTATLTPTTAVGGVAFYDGSTSLGSVTVTSGSAILSTTTLGVGSTHSFVAIFTPTNSTATDPTAFKGSQSAAVPYTITAADTSTATLTGPDGATLSSNPTLTLGEVVTVQAGGFTAGESVTVVVHSTPETLTPTTASSTGAVTYQFTVPSDLPTGAHSLVLTGATSQTVVTINFSIATPEVLGTTTTSTPSAGSASLPFTGSDIELLAVIAIICTTMGIAMRTRKQAPRYAGAHEWRRQH